jgi:hypothetical protein
MDSHPWCSVHALFCFALCAGRSPSFAAGLPSSKLLRPRPMPGVLSFQTTMLGSGVAARSCRNGAAIPQCPGPGVAVVTVIRCSIALLLHGVQVDCMRGRRGGHHAWLRRLRSGRSAPKLVFAGHSQHVMLISIHIPNFHRNCRGRKLTG